jgi:hypothetical protein
VSARNITAHICFGDRVPQLPKLQELACNHAVDWWTINRHATGGDIALFYIKRPLSAFVAWGVVVSGAGLRAEGPWAGHYAASVAQVRMLSRPVPRLELCQHLPEWGYLRSPRQSVAVPGEFFEPLMSALAIPWQEAAAVF